jgi:hypothetical protein
MVSVGIIPFTFSGFLYWPRALNGKSYFDWISDFKKERDGEEYRLSESEVQIIRLVVDGKGNVGLPIAYLFQKIR